MTVMSDFGNILIIYSLKASTILLNICIDLIILLIMFEEMERLVFLIKYEILRTLNNI